MKLTSILVLLDSSGSVPALKAAVELSDKTGAELKAVYIENLEWFEASKHHFTQQISSYTGQVLPFTEEHIQKQSRAMGTLFQKQVHSFAEETQITYSFHSVRGVLGEELRKAASGTDLVMIGRTAGPGIGINNAVRLISYTTEYIRGAILIWSDSPAWPLQLIGLCTTMEKSLSVAEWTLGLGKITGQMQQLFWPEEVNISQDWIRQLEETEKSEMDMETQILRISEVHPVLSLEVLNRYRNSLIIMRRQDLITRLESGEALKSIRNPILLL